MSRFLIVGDNDVTGGSKLVYKAMKKIKDVSRYIHVGDLPYSKEGKKWINVHKQFWTEQEKEDLWRVTKGNHDCNSSEDNQTQWDLQQYFKRHHDQNISPSDDEDDIKNIRKNTWLESEVVDNVFIINLDSEDLDVEKKDSDQYKWVSETVAPEVKKLKAEGKIDWVFVLFHQPFFTLKASHKPYTAVRHLYRNIFKDIEVDVCIHGHNHNTQLWFPMRPHQTDVNAVGKQLFSFSSDGKTFDFTKEHGWLTIISGHGGHEWNEIIEGDDDDDDDDKVAGIKNLMHYRDGHKVFFSTTKEDAQNFRKDTGLFGFTQIDITGKNMNVKSIDSDSTVLYEYNVTKDGNTTTDTTEKTIAKLSAPAQTEIGSTVILDGSASQNYQKLEIIQTSGQNVELQNIANAKWQFVCPQQEMQLGFQLKLSKDMIESTDEVTIDIVKSLQKFNEHDVLMLYPTIGKPVKMEVGKFRDGQRYNKAFQFKNYMMIGYFKTGKGQTLIEMKTDGPCHGCGGNPAKVPIGMWYEPHFILKSGHSVIKAEGPHDPRYDYPDDDGNFDIPKDELTLKCDTQKLDGGIKEQWIGYAVIAYTLPNQDQNRVIEQWVSRNPFKDMSTPAEPTNDWKLTLRAVERGDGNLFPVKVPQKNKKGEPIPNGGNKIIFPRDLQPVLDYDHGNGEDKGFEAEIRNFHSEDKDEEGRNMKWAYVYEIIPPAQLKNQEELTIHSEKTKPN